VEGDAESQRTASRGVRADLTELRAALAARSWKTKTPRQQRFSSTSNGQRPASGTWPIVGTIVRSRGWKLLHGDESHLVESGEKSIAMYAGTEQRWLITYRGMQKKPSIRLDRRTARQIEVDNERNAKGKPCIETFSRKRRVKRNKPIRVVSGGLPSLGKRH